MAPWNCLFFSIDSEVMSADADFKLKVPKLGEMKPMATNICHRILHLIPLVLVGGGQKSGFLFIYWASFLSVQVKDVRKISSKNPRCSYTNAREEIVLSEELTKLTYIPTTHFNLDFV